MDSWKISIIVRPFLNCLCKICSTILDQSWNWEYVRYWNHAFIINITFCIRFQMHVPHLACENFNTLYSIELQWIMPATNALLSFQKLSYDWAIKSNEIFEQLCFVCFCRLFTCDILASFAQPIVTVEQYKDSCSNNRVEKGLLIKDWGLGLKKPIPNPWNLSI